MLCDLRVHECLDEDATDYRSRLEAHLPTTDGVVIISGGHSGRSLIGPDHQAMDKISILPIIGGERRGPYLPIELRNGFTVVERQAIGLHLLRIECPLGLHQLLWEEMKIEYVVPDKVIFLAPGAGLVQRDRVMNSIDRHTPPLSG